MDLVMYERLMQKLNLIEYKIDKTMEGLGLSLDENGELIYLDEEEDQEKDKIKVKSKELQK